MKDLFYKFLVEEGILFRFMDSIDEPLENYVSRTSFQMLLLPLFFDDTLPLPVYKELALKWQLTVHNYRENRMDEAHKKAQK